MLALTFANPSDYDKISPRDKITIKGLTNFTPGVSLIGVIEKEDGSTKEITLNHTFNESQIKWYKAGSALNYMKQSKK